MYLAYTYFVRNKITNQFYYGSRFHNTKRQRTPEEDFWIYYFTTSKIVKNDIKIYGKDQFEYKIIYKNEDYNLCYWYEQDLIKEHIKNPLCLNRHYVDRKSNNQKFSAFGLIHTEESKIKMSKAKTGKSLPRTKETTDKIVSTRKKNNIRPTEEAKKKQSESMKGRIPWNKGIESSQETKDKQSQSLKNKPWSENRRFAQIRRNLPTL